MVNSSIANFAAPGHGQWNLDRSHYPGGATPIVQWLVEKTMEAGMRRVFAELGTPADALRARFVNGCMYTRLLPLIGPEKAPRPLPPKPILKARRATAPGIPSSGIDGDRESADSSLDRRN